MKWHHWTIVALGFWLAFSPWLLGFGSVNLITWNSLIIGSFIIILALWNMTPPED